MKVYDEIMAKLKNDRIHMTLIDPASQDAGKAALIARKADQAGTDFFMIGGSTEIDAKSMDCTIAKIREVTDKKIIIFPGSSSMLSTKADAIYFMTLLNSRNPEFIVKHQAKAAPILRKVDMETISMGYLILKPGMTVGRIGEADLLDEEKPEEIISYAIAAEMFNLKLLYLEAGSGSPSHIKPDTVRKVRESVELPIIVGGGIRTPEASRKIAKAGADIIVTGTVAEKSSNIEVVLGDIIRSIKRS
ncbi:geranylgeranylglyceryl/heptaprenylglyceryl phosphate synthase [Oxyplasma meridianum]|uniref:Geranylgeranylglyceryl phosphate synthase n=1 Tax=Oxyplasma meridianum TaxID=3073602 RepID=A0AAX4NH51_9ARCH